MTQQLTDDWWFCTPPTREEVRFRTDRRTGQVLGVVLTCPHGSWDDIGRARHAHGFTIDASEPQPALSP